MAYLGLGKMAYLGLGNMAVQQELDLTYNAIMLAK
jgi:hypothetical protein